MVVGIILGAIGSLIAIFSMKCLKMGSMDDNIKATMTLTAGIMNVLAGAVAFTTASRPVAAAMPFFTHPSPLFAS